jgi:hypothetical protein
MIQNVQHLIDRIHHKHILAGSFCPQGSFAWGNRNAVSKMKLIMPATQKRGNFKTSDYGDSYII